MGYEVERFQCDVDEELLCPICSGVLENPVIALGCEHAFCRICIDEWLSRHLSCPVDRQFLSSDCLRPVPRMVKNILSRLLIKCDNENFGCSQVLKLEHLETHMKNCECNSKRHMLSKYEDMKQRVNEIRRNLELWFLDMESRICDLDRRIRSEYVKRWVVSLERSRVTNWDGLVAVPDSKTLCEVHRALRKSGCPSDLTVQLVTNADVRRWPPGFRMLQVTGNSCGNYYCRKIPGVRAIAIMAIDNPHMKDDMILKPGLMMIFHF